MKRHRCPWSVCRCNNRLCANAREADERRLAKIYEERAMAAYMASLTPERRERVREIEEMLTR